MNYPCRAARLSRAVVFARPRPNVIFSLPSLVGKNSITIKSRSLHATGKKGRKKRKKEKKEKHCKREKSCFEYRRVASTFPGTTILTRDRSRCGWTGAEITNSRNVESREIRERDGHTALFPLTWCFRWSVETRVHSHHRGKSADKTFDSWNSSKGRSMSLGFDPYRGKVGQIECRGATR